MKRVSGKRRKLLKRYSKIRLQKKYTRIIEKFARKEKIPLADALSFFYHSSLYQLMSEGVSDLHCMSDDYLVDDLDDEYIK